MKKDFCSGFSLSLCIAKWKSYSILTLLWDSFHLEESFKCLSYERAWYQENTSWQLVRHLSAGFACLIGMILARGRDVKIKDTECGAKKTTHCLPGGHRARAVSFLFRTTPSHTLAPPQLFRPSLNLTPPTPPLPIQVTHFHVSFLHLSLYLYLSTKPISQFQRKTFNWLCCSLKNTILNLLSFTGNVDNSVCFLFFLLLKSSLEFSEGSLPQVLPLLSTLAYFSLPCWVLSHDPGPVMEHCIRHNGPLTGSFWRLGLSKRQGVSRFPSLAWPRASQSEAHLFQQWDQISLKPWCTNKQHPLPSWHNLFSSCPLPSWVRMDAVPLSCIFPGRTWEVLLPG